MRVVIPSAGMGTRLGMNKPKGLVEIKGRPLVAWQMDSIPPGMEVCVVVGYQADLMKTAILKAKPDAMIVENVDFRTTGVAKSVLMGCQKTEGNVIVLDGDILSTKSLISQFQSMETLVGIREKASWDRPVLVSINDGMVTRFSREEGDFEWACVACMSPSLLRDDDDFFYRGLERSLPAKTVLIEAPEIDTIEDLKEAEKWASTNL